MCRSMARKPRRRSKAGLLSFGREREQRSERMLIN